MPLRIDRKRVREYINGKYSVQQLLASRCKVRVSVGQTFRCPFHDDNRKSAKLYPDNAFFCFAEGRQYKAHEIMLMTGTKIEELAKEVPDSYVQVEEKPKDIVSLYGEAVSRIRKQYIKTGDLRGLIEDWKREVINGRQAGVAEGKR